MFEAYLISLGASLTIESAKFAFNYVKKKRPDLADRVKRAEEAGDIGTIDRVFREAVDVIDLAAANGEITIDNGTLTALKGIRFDHEHGRVFIEGTNISAPILVTGGQRGSTGETQIGGNTTLSTGGTRISVGKGASIRITGNASIRQS